MKTIKLSKDLKELLALHDVPADTIQLVEDYYSTGIDTVKEHYEAEKVKVETVKPLSLAEMASNARIIK